MIYCAIYRLLNQLCDANDGNGGLLVRSASSAPVLVGTIVVAGAVPGCGDTKVLGVAAAVLVLLAAACRDNVGSDADDGALLLARSVLLSAALDLRLFG